MNQITKEALEFVEEAKKAFTENDDFTTYRNKEENFIALRGGMRDDCMTVYELGDPVGNFVEQLPRQHKVLVDYEDYEKLKKLKKVRSLAEHELERAKTLLNNKSDMDYNNGFGSAMAVLLKEMNKSGI